MKLKNSALQELYDTIVNGTLTFSPGEASPIDKAFKECDEKLSDSVTFATIKDLQDRNDILERSNKHLLEANMESISKTRKLEKDLDNAKKNVEYFRDCRDDWRARAKHAEKEAEDLASQYQKLTIENKRLLDANTTLEKASDDRTNFREACDKLSGENMWLNARIDCLRLEVNWYRKHYKEQSDKINELTKNYQDLSIKLKRHQINVGRESRYLWDMLQEVSDYYYFGGDDEFDTDDCEMTSMTDIIDNLNVNQFLDAYKSWKEKKDQERIKHMRDYLERFCMGRFCYNCPLHTVGLLCERGKRFCDMSDEDLKKYYEKARACSKSGKTSFETWTCTLEGTVEINKDLLNKVYGIDSDD